MYIQLCVMSSPPHAHPQREIGAKYILLNIMRRKFEK